MLANQAERGGGEDGELQQRCNQCWLQLDSGYDSGMHDATLN